MSLKHSLVMVIAATIWVAAVLCIQTPTASAEDTIKILDGGEVKGHIIEETEDYVLIRRKSGDIQEIKRDYIEEIRRGPVFADEFKSKWNKLPPDDADAAFELGLWCEDRGHAPEANRCFKRVIGIDPDHMVAREKLGHLYYDGKWYESPEGYYTARGYVQYNGEWIPKKDKSKYEAGLVKLEDGTWISKDKYEQVKRRPSATPSGSRPGSGRLKSGKKKWKRQKLDKAFYADFSGRTPWADRRRHESKHYIIESNCSMKHVKRYARMLDLIYVKFVKVFGKPKSDRRCLVRIYASKQEFMRHTGRGRGVGGFYGGGRVSVFHGRFGSTGSTQTVLFHECTHQFHDMIGGLHRSQIWFYEGLACFFECSEIDDHGKIHIGVVNRDRLRRVQSGIKRGRYIDVGALLATGRGRFSGTHYAYAWTVIYFLVYTNPNNRKLFNRYWTQVCCGSGERTGAPKFKKMIGVPVRELNDCWKEWVMMLGRNDLPEEVEEKSKNFFKEYKKKKSGK